MSEILQVELTADMGLSGGLAPGATEQFQMKRIRQALRAGGSYPELSDNDFKWLKEYAERMITDY
jgi:hypothetical protein